MARQIRGATGHKLYKKSPVCSNMEKFNLSKLQIKLKRAWSKKTVAWKMQLVANVVALTLDAVCLCITGDVSSLVSVCSDVYALGQQARDFLTTVTEAT